MGPLPTPALCLGQFVLARCDETETIPDILYGLLGQGVFHAGRRRDLFEYF